MADSNPASTASIKDKYKNSLLHSSVQNPANPGYPINSDNFSKYPPNNNLPYEINNPANPGYPINAARY